MRNISQNVLRNNSQNTVAKFMAVYDNNADLAVDNSQSFKYKAALAGKTSDYVNPNSFVKNAKIVVPLKYLRNF